MTERVAIITVLLMDIDIKGDPPAFEDSRVHGTTTNWVTEDMTCAETLMTQLRGLLGDPSRETIQPEVPASAIEHLRWPGQVSVDKEDV